MFDFLYSWLESVFSGHPLLILFSSGFFSATLLPGGSEISLIAALKLLPISTFSIVLAATLGNSLGGLTNYWLGLYLPNRNPKHHKLEYYMQRYGYWTLLLSWLPIVGDPLCVVAGWLRMKFVPVVIMITLGKAARYTFLALLINGMIS